MYFNFSGCLIFLLIFLITLYLLKELWWLIVGIAVIITVAYWGRRIYMLLYEKEKNKEYTPEMGEVFKICPYCNSKIKVTEIKCPVCKRELN